MPRRFFRIIKWDVPTASDFMSNAEKGRPLLSDDPTLRRVHDGISVWNERRLARKKAEMSPRLGSFIAELTISDEDVFSIEPTFAFGHYTVWGDAEELLRRVTTVTPVDNIRNSS